MRIRSLTYTLVLALTMLSIVGCSPMRFVPEGETYLKKVSMTSDQSEVKANSYRRFVRQETNTKWFSCLRVPLGFYCMSTTDSTKRWNRFMHHMGEAPVIYDQNLTDYTVMSLQSTLQAKGWLQATVDADTTTNAKRHTRICYKLHPGLRSYVTSLDYQFDSAEMEALVMAKDIQEGTLLYKGMPFDLTVLDKERQRIISHLQDKGYYFLNKEFITFKADTLTNDYGVDVTMRMQLPPNVQRDRAYRAYSFGDINVKKEGNGHLRNKMLSNHIYVKADSTYSETAIRNTYQSLNALSAINYTTIHVNEPRDTSLLDTDITVALAKQHGLNLELEGTNTAGDLGAAVVMGYSNRNLFRGSEVLSLKLRGAYEAITGLDGYDNQNYIEYSAEASLRFPTFMMPMSQRRRQRLKASTELTFLYNSQDRPEFHRRLLTATWSYLWNKHSNQHFRHRFDLLSLNYLFMPWISPTFRKEYLENTTSRNSVLRYSYEDIFIMKTGYNFTYNSLSGKNTSSLYHTNGYQVRFAVETAGNLLYGISKIFNYPRRENGYHFLKIPYSQYTKLDFDFSKSVQFTEHSSIAFHGAFGIAIPYGNSSVIPYEKRYFSGGANSVRGWSVRELGPGRFTGKDGKIDFINQTGNLKLDLSIEYRTFLFWKFDGAVFIDAGNIWSTRNYEGQEGGQFKINEFYRQIAVSYGLGARLNFNYFILRFDGGMKAINPAYESGAKHYPVIHPNFKRDFTFHFAVGLPF